MPERMTDERISDAIIAANESEFGDTLVVLELLAVVAHLLKDRRSADERISDAVIVYGELLGDESGEGPHKK